MYRYRDDAPRRILVVDDNPAIHEDFRKIRAPANPPGLVEIPMLRRRTGNAA